MEGVALGNIIAAQGPHTGLGALLLLQYVELGDRLRQGHIDVLLPFHLTAKEASR